MGASERRYPSSQVLGGRLGIDLSKMQEGKKECSAGKAAPAKPQRCLCPTWRIWSAWNSQASGVSYAWTKQAGRVGRSKIMACPEGNREPLKGLEQGTDMGIVATYEDLLNNLLPCCGRTAGSSSQCGAAAPCNGGLLPASSCPSTGLQATCLFPLML